MSNPMHILVTHGSRHGGTEDLARTVGEALADAGHTVEVRPAHEPDGLDAWDAVIVGGALYILSRAAVSRTKRPIWSMRPTPPRCSRASPPSSTWTPCPSG